MAKELSDYRGKRDFTDTPEPKPKRARRKPATKPPRFVIQQHDATRLHWDLRLEHDGVAASWALPRGMPADPKRNHLAVRTEDHPLEYLEFKGEIPKGNYGAGTMEIWDHGTYEPEKWRDDEVIVVLHGERVDGRYALFRSGRGERDWLIHRMSPAVDPDREPMPEDLAPMLAKPGKLPRNQERWAFEIKWDGVRALTYSEPGGFRLRSRNRRDITASYPELRRLGRALGSHSAILDGEIVAFGDDGRPSFARLQERMHVASESTARRRAEKVPAVYMLFDLLWLDGHSLLELPYAERRARLEELELRGPSWQTPAAHTGDGEALLAATAEQGLEGLVAKRRDSPYESGRRSGAWLKIKNVRRQELVIGGWIPGQGKRENSIGALVVGYYDPEGRFVYAGRVGTGFSERTLRELGERLAPLRREASPFEIGDPPREAIFVEPALVAEVGFGEWTPDGMLRHPSFLGLRDDRPAAEVGREEPLAVSEDARAARQEDDMPPIAGASGSRREEPPWELLSESDGGREVLVEGRTLKFSNWEKLLYPASGFTKGQVIEYYASVGPAILPHLRDRPLTLKRYPNGVEDKFFYEKNCPSHRPNWVQTARVRTRDGAVNFCLVQDLPTLLWAANLASLELHTQLARHQAIERPTMMVFDLDPGPPAELLQCCEVALVLRSLFEGLGLQSYAKTSGAKGMQVYVPLNTEDLSYERTKGFSRRVAELLAAQAPDLVVARMTKSARTGRVFVDWSQNDKRKTTVNVYSLRAQPEPTVSTPVTWDEIEAAREAGDSATLRFRADAVLARLRRDGDLFAPVAELVQELPEL